MIEVIRIEEPEVGFRDRCVQPPAIPDVIPESAQDSTWAYEPPHDEAFRPQNAPLILPEEEDASSTLRENDEPLPSSTAGPLRLGSPVLSPREVRFDCSPAPPEDLEEKSPGEGHDLFDAVSWIPPPPAESFNEEEFYSASSSGWQSVCERSEGELSSLDSTDDVVFSETSAVSMSDSALSVGSGEPDLESIWLEATGQRCSAPQSSSIPVPRKAHAEEHSPSLPPLPEGERAQASLLLRQRVASPVQCAICYENLCSQQVSILLDEYSRRVCRHFYHSSCVRILANRTLQCPLCRAEFCDHEAVPDPREDASGWFHTVDFNGCDAMERADVIDGLLTLLPVDPERLDAELPHLWRQWDPENRGTLSPQAFKHPQGLLQWLVGHLDVLQAEGRGPIPDLGDCQAWFRYWDVRHCGRLCKDEITRAVTQTFPSLDGPQLQSLVLACWPDLAAGTGNVSLEKFLVEGPGLLATILANAEYTEAEPEPFAELEWDIPD